MTTIQEYVEASLYWYPGMYKDRFHSIFHIFCCNGNGIWLNKDGYLYDICPATHPRDDPDNLLLSKKSKQLHQSNSDMIDRMRHLGIEIEEENYLEKDLELARSYKEIYATEPTVLKLQAWYNNIEFQTFRSFVECKSADFRKTVEYLCIVIENATEDMCYQMTDSYYTQKYKDKQNIRYMKNFRGWKENIHLVREILLGV